MQINSTALKNIIRFGRGFLLSLCCGLTVSFVVLGSLPSAIAAPIQPSFAATPTEMKDLANEVKDRVDTIGGAGTSKRIEGRVEEGKGTVQRNASRTKREVQGVAKQVEGRAKRDVGRIQNTNEDIRAEVKDSAEKVGDKVKDLFRK
jgi:uncharacterized protein YjbJ (UPF0337 family)